jgi:hypothetical protein
MKFYLFHSFFWGHKVKQDELDRAFSTHKRENKCHTLMAEGRPSVLFGLAIYLCACEKIIDEILKWFSYWVRNVGLLYADT